MKDKRRSIEYLSANEREMSEQYLKNWSRARAALQPSPPKALELPDKKMEVFQMFLKEVNGGVKVIDKDGNILDDRVYRKVNPRHGKCVDCDIRISAGGYQADDGNKISARWRSPCACSQ